MRRVTSALLISLFAMFGSAAHAVDFPDGMYWGANIGVARDKDICDSLPVPPGFSDPNGCSDSDIGWQLFLGWQILKWVSIEGGYTDLGNSDIQVVDRSVHTDLAGFNLSTVFTAPVLEKIGLYGTVGAFFWDLDVRSETINTSSTTSDSGTDYYYGIGFRWPLSETIGINMEAKRFNDIGSNETGTADIDLYSVGMLFRF